MTAARFLVSGRVQGVGYRYFVMREASALGVVGYARNQADGTVEVVAEAAREALRSLEERLREGPSFSEVADVQRQDVEPTGCTDFRIR